MHSSPSYPESTLITGVTLSPFRIHKGDGDMWPLTWAADGNLYGGAGDNLYGPSNFWRIESSPEGPNVFIQHPCPVPLEKIRRVHHEGVGPSIKPAGVLSVDGTLYFAVEAMHYGNNPAFHRQENIQGWILTSRDFGLSWDTEATPHDFFTRRLSSIHFLQFGQDYAGARDEYVYAYFPAADDGNSDWENGDFLLLGRVPRGRICERGAWEFIVDLPADAPPHWSADDRHAVPVFRYPLMTGEDHVAYNAGLGRYILGNYSFTAPDGTPRPYHQGYHLPGVETRWPSQLTLFEAPEPWGPWSLFYRDDNWGTYGDYQPNFPTKWMSEDGAVMHMVSSGTQDDYNFTVQQLMLEIAVK